MWRNSRLATRRCQGTSAVAILWPRGLAVHIAPSVEASSTRSRSVAGSKASRHEEEKKWVKTQRFSYLKSLKWKDSEDLHQRITLCFFCLLVKGMHPQHIVKATLGSRNWHARISICKKVKVRKHRNDSYIDTCFTKVYHIMIVLMPHLFYDSWFIFILKPTLFIWKWWYLKISAFLRSEFRRQFWLYDLRQVWWKASNGTVPAFSERSWKTQRCVGSGSPAFWCKFSFKFSEWNIFLCLKRAEWVRVRDRILTHFCLPFSCINPKKNKVNYGCKNNPHQMGGSGGNYVLRSLVPSYCCHFVEKNACLKSFLLMNSTNHRCRNARVISQPGDGSCLYHSISFGLGDTDRFVMREWTDERNFS